MSITLSTDVQNHLQNCKHCVESIDKITPKAIEAINLISETLGKEKKVNFERDFFKLMCQNMGPRAPLPWQNSQKLDLAKTQLEEHNKKVTLAKNSLSKEELIFVEGLTQCIYINRIFL